MKSAENGDADVMSAFYNYKENPFASETGAEWNISSSVTQFEYYLLMQNGGKKFIEVKDLTSPVEI